MHFMLRNIFPQNRAVYEIMWDNTVQPDRPQMTISRMRIAYWITKATNTHSEYVILTATGVAQILLNITLHIHCLSASYVGP